MTDLPNTKNKLAQAVAKLTSRGANGGAKPMPQVSLANRVVQAAPATPLTKAQTATQKVLLARANALANQKEVEEAAKLAAANTEVPPDIWALPTELTELSGFPTEAIQQDLATLYQRLEADQPDIAGLLERININMRQFEELAYLLTPEQLGLIFKGTMRVTNTEIAPKTKGKTKVADLTKNQIQNLDFGAF